jgi:WD40 repeat protein
MRKSQGSYLIKRVLMVASALLFNVSIQAEEAPSIVITKEDISHSNSVAISSDGNYIASGNNDKTVYLWEVKTGKEIRFFLGHASSVTSVAFSGDSKTLVSGSGDKTMRLWEVNTGKEIRTFLGHTSGVTSVDLGGDDQTLVSGSWDRTVRLWDVHTGKEILTFMGHTDYVTSVALSGDGQTLVSGSNDKTVRFWDIQSGKEIRTFTGHTSGVTSVALSGDGQTLVSGSSDSNVYIWDVKTGKKIRTLVGNTYPVTSVAISIDGQTLAFGSSDNKVRILELKSNKGICTLKGHTLGIVSVALFSGSNYIVSLSGDGEIKIWDLQNASLLATLITFNYNEWVAYTPDNYYITSPGGQKYVSFKVGITLYDSEKYASLFNKADGVADRLKKITKMHTPNIETTKSKDKQPGDITIPRSNDTAKGDNSLRNLVKSVFGKKRSWAVLIGIKDYSLQRNGMKPLPYGLNDVQAVKKYLINELDFDKDNIKTLVDSQATREEIVKELGEKIPRSVDIADRVLVYFSVHGGKEIIKTDEGEKTFSYLIPYDGKQKSLFSTGISMEVLSLLSERIPAKHVLFIIDACFSGNIGQIISKTGIYSEETKKEIETFIKNKGREVMTAGTMDEEASMGDKWENHSVYTYYLLKGLRGGADYNQNKVITLTELQLYLETKVPKEAHQTPQRITLDSSRGGQFVFYREGED